MPDLSAADYQLARFLIERGLGILYLVAFLVAARQFPALCGERGLTPASQVVRATTFLEAPTIFRLGYSDARLRVVAWTGVVLAVLIVLGLPQRAPLPVTMLVWLVLWALYLSILNVGGRLYSFGWETLLCEAGFLAIFLGNAEIAPPWPVILAFRWLAFRVEFGAGLIKLRGDRCWRDLLCMEWHHETQPMPNPMSWFFHRLPRSVHRIEAAGNFVAQLVVPFALFLPQPIATIAALFLIGTQLYLVVSGNYAWLNWVTIVALFAGIGDAVVPPGILDAPGLGAVAPAEAPAWFVVAVIALTVAVVVLSYYPVRNMASPYQAMNASFDPFRLVNTYGAFGTVSRERFEVIIEGSPDDLLSGTSEWREYEFKGKPGDPHRMPPQVAPYHHRLDWLMWFLPLSASYGDGWFLPFLARLLQGDTAILRLLRTNPFPDRPPVHVRARLFGYRFSSWPVLRRTGAWWEREHVGEFVPPVRLADPIGAALGNAVHPASSGDLRRSRP